MYITRTRACNVRTLACMYVRIMRGSLLLKGLFSSRRITFFSRFLFLRSFFFAFSFRRFLFLSIQPVKSIYVYKRILLPTNVMNTLFCLFRIFSFFFFFFLISPREASPLSLQRFFRQISAISRDNDDSFPPFLFPSRTSK